MPMPGWWGQINKRVFNPTELKRGIRPALAHVGRSSGTTYRTPLDAHPVDDGYLFILVHGSGPDWVRNVLAAGHARLSVGGEHVDSGLRARDRRPLSTGGIRGVGSNTSGRPPATGRRWLRVAVKRCDASPWSTRSRNRP
ncbi:MAG TPA: nitroreductase/quinone reductase family protein [Jiangellaceae bacterium]